MAKLNVQKLKASELELKEKVVNIRRVTKVTKGGRTFSFSATVVIGNGNGIVGEGLGKAREVRKLFKKLSTTLRRTWLTFRCSKELSRTFSSVSSVLPKLCCALPLKVPV